MKRNLNRGISILLSVCMVLSILAGSGISLVRAESATTTGTDCEHNAPEGYCTSCDLELPAKVTEPEKEELFSNGALQSTDENGDVQFSYNGYKLATQTSGWVKPQAMSAVTEGATYYGAFDWEDGNASNAVLHVYDNDSGYATAIQYYQYKLEKGTEYTLKFDAKCIGTQSPTVIVRTPDKVDLLSIAPSADDWTTYEDTFTTPETDYAYILIRIGTDKASTGYDALFDNFSLVKTCAHTWENPVVSAANCTNGTTRTVTCDCGAVGVTEYGEALGHTLVGGTCSVCGAACEHNAPEGYCLNCGLELPARVIENEELFSNGALQSTDENGDVQFSYNGYYNNTQTSGWVSPKEMSDIAEGTQYYAAFDWENGNASNAVLHVYDADNPKAAAIQYYQYKLEKGTEYTLKFDAKSSGTKSPTVYVRTPDKVDLETVTPTEADWTTYEVTFTTPTEDYDCIVIRIGTGTSATGYDALFDNFSLFKTHAHEWENPVVSDANCTNGTTRTVTCECGAVGVTEYGEISENAHNIVAVEAKEATCTAEGNVAYWYCSICNAAWADEALTQTTNLKSVKIPMADHVYANPCDAHCMICYELTNPDAAHNIKAVEGKDATCIANGNVAYWYCDDCGAAWTDEALTQVTNLKSVIIPATGEHNYVDGKCSVCGEADPNAPTGPIADKNLTFLGAAGISFQDYIGMNIMFYNGTAANYDKFYAVATQVDPDGNAVETLCNVVPYSYGGYDYTIFEHQVMAWSMTEQVTLTLYAEKDGVVYVGQSIVTSVQALALEKLASYAAANNTVSCAALVDMLNYGAAVQVNQNHFVESLPSAGDYASYGTTTTPEFNATNSVTGSGIVGYGPSISMQAKVEFNVMYYGADLEGKTVKAFVDGEEVEVLYNYDAAPGWPIARIAVAANKLRSTYTIAVYDANGNVVSQVIEASIEACAKSHIGGANNDLVIALMRYGDSVSKVG